MGNRRMDVLAFLHSTTWANQMHHYSVFIDYTDGRSEEIKMIVPVNMRDWSDVKPKRDFDDEYNTMTSTAVTIPHPFRRQVSLYQTFWRNPYPAKAVRQIRFVKNPNSNGVPVLVAVTVGSFSKKSGISPEQKEREYEKIVAAAYRLQKNGKYTDAIRLYNRALNLLPNRLGIYYSIAFCYEKLGDYENAANTYRASLDKDYNQPNVWDLLKKAKEKGNGK